MANKSILKRKPIIAGNWKMHGSRASIKLLLEGIKNQVNTQAEVIVFPPYVFLEQTEKTLTGSNIAWGAQNVSDKQAGAFTGEISAAMLADFNCRYVLIGHSERRSLYHESDQLVAEKYKAVLAANMTPIICVGETLEQRKAGQTLEIIQKQLAPIVNYGINHLQQAVIAYEPVWAIGTGQTAAPEMAQEVHSQIRAFIASYAANIAENIRILYGGSVKLDNAATLFKMPDIDGGLIGGASLNVDEFVGIVKCKLF